jgi:integrase
VDLDADTVAVLRNHRRERGAMALQLARDDALVFADEEGRPLYPEGISGRFKAEIGKTSAELPPIRLHDLRHTHATLLLSAREPVHVVSRRLDHASPNVTMAVYAHVLPGSQREAANLFASLIAEAKPS